jgi:hypothetical protein
LKSVLTRQAKDEMIYVESTAWARKEDSMIWGMFTILKYNITFYHLNLFQITYTLNRSRE